MMLIDVHAHIGWLGRKRGQRPSESPECFISAEDVLRNMDRYGIDKACVLPLSDCPEGNYLASSTEEVIAACARYPERLIPFCLVHPRFGDNSPEMDFSGLLADYKARGCVAVGEMVANLWIDDPHGVNLWRQAGVAGLPVLFDMTARVGTHYGVVDDPGLPRLERVLQECPDTIFIGHGPTFWAEISPNSANENRAAYPTAPFEGDGAVARLMQKYSNLWADTSAGSGYNALTRVPEYGVAFLERFQDQILFGTDNCTSVATDRDMAAVYLLRDSREQGKLSKEACRKISHGNAVRLLGL